MNLILLICIFQIFISSFGVKNFVQFLNYFEMVPEAMVQYPLCYIFTGFRKWSSGHSGWMELRAMTREVEPHEMRGMKDTGLEGTICSHGVGSPIGKERIRKGFNCKLVIRKMENGCVPIWFLNLKEKGVKLYVSPLKRKKSPSCSRNYEGRNKSYNSQSWFHNFLFFIRNGRNSTLFPGL